MKIGNLYINEDKIIAIETKENMLRITLTKGIIHVSPEGTSKSFTDSHFVSKKEFKQLKENIELRYT